MDRKGVALHEESARPYPEGIRKAGSVLGCGVSLSDLCFTQMSLAAAWRMS